jgi:phenylalanyl-tRNA synthetase beta chain
MKISWQWLREFVDIDVSPQQLAADLTNVGVVVETVRPLESDFLFELDLTTNRPDCLSHVGVAREVSALYKKSLRQIHTCLEQSLSPAKTQVSVEIESPKLCARYSARVLRGVKVAPSPEWLVRRLEALGLRSINNIADITNYVLMELGQPLHAFDLLKIEGRKIIVREARDEESLVTIDGLERKLNRGMLVIADEAQPVALAGIMGGLESEIGFSTREILLESAWFNPISIRKTSKLLGMHTEASHRFERGADVNATVLALDRAAVLIQQLTGGEIQRGIVDCYPQIVRREPLFLRKSRITQVMGCEIEQLAVEEILNLLDFKIVERLAEGWRVDLPTSRLDVESEIDLIEEIARHYGYDKFPSTLPSWKGGSHRRPEYPPETILKERLMHLGYSETLTYSFIDESENRRFAEHEPIRLQNPLSTEMAEMRTSMLPGLLHSFLRNYNRGIKSARLYEMGKIYRKTAGQQVQEEDYLGMIASGNYQEKGVHSVSRPLNFFDLKGDIEILLQSLGVPVKEVCFLGSMHRMGQGQMPCLPPSHYHPGVSAEMRWRDQKLGRFGQLHPKVCEPYKIKQPVLVAEVPLQHWYNLRTAEKAFHEIPRFPSVQRDLSMFVNKDIDYSRIEATIQEANIKEIQKVFPFDLYVGDKLPSDKKGISISIVYQALDRTLTEEEVNQRHEKVVALLIEKLGVEIRVPSKDLM